MIGRGTLNEFDWFLVQSTQAERVLDVAGSLRRMSGKSSLYVRLANLFREKWLDAPDRIEPLLGSDISRATAIAHSLRGAAALIGGTNVCDIARRIECGLRGGLDVSEEMPALRSAMCLLSAMLENLPAHGAAQPSREVSFSPTP
jgi:HPt (histidine-containing phosphotransfer) domain-containing protein